MSEGCQEEVTHSSPNARSNRFQLASCALSSLQREGGGRQERREERRKGEAGVRTGGGRVDLN